MRSRLAVAAAAVLVTFSAAVPARADAGAIATRLSDSGGEVGLPGVPVRLEWQDPSRIWRLQGEARTDADGRISRFGNVMRPGRYRLVCAVEGYFRAKGIEPFFPEAVVVFDVRDTQNHYYLPIRVSPSVVRAERGS